MAGVTKREEQSPQYKSIRNNLSVTLETLRLQFLERFQELILPLAPVNDITSGQWERRLSQAKYRTGEHITLIPYDSGNFHWVGVVIQFNADTQVERAAFIDPVEQSSFNPAEVQKRFAQFYPNVILQSRTLQKHENKEQSATLTVENLFKVAEEFLLTNAACTGANRSERQTFDDLNASNNSTNKESGLQTLTATEGNVSKVSYPEQIPNSEADKLDCQDVTNLCVKVPQTEHSTEQHVADDRDVNINREEISADKLDGSQHSTAQSLSEKDNPVKRESYEVLKKELEDRLAEHDLGSKKELEQQIIEKKHALQSLKNEGKHNLAQRRQNSLSELEQLQSLIDQLEAIESSQSKSDCEMLRKKVDDGFAEHDISSKEELKQQITEKKQTIESLKDGGKHKLAQKRQISLEKLEDLQSLVEQLGAIELLSLNDNYEVLEKQIADSLAKHDLASKEGLKEEIMKQKQAIQSLEAQGKQNLVRKRQDSLSKLEQIQSLIDQLEIMKPSQPNHDYKKKNEYKEEGCPITEEDLWNTQKDIELMPLCSEKFIITLLLYVSFKLAGNTIVSNRNIKIPDELETEMLKELKYLQERLKVEHLEFKGIQGLVEECFRNLKVKNWTATLILLRKLLKYISPLDVQELFRLVEKVEDAAQVIKEKDIILFLGGTGSGKSTTIHFLSGSKMVERNIAGLNHIEPIEIKNLELENIITSPFSRSETRYITPVTVNFQDVGGYTNGTIILCDSPGFEDTSGPEVDIANGIGIVKAIKGCKSVKPVVLCSFKGIGDRCDGIKNLAHVLVGLIPEIKDHIKAFSYIFTKFPEKERKTIHALLRDVNSKLNEEDRTNIGFTEFLTDMLQKTKKNPRTLDPINDDPEEILHELVHSPSIFLPEEVFQFYITEKSKATVKEQVRKHQLSIMSATKRSEYRFIKYKLDQLKRLGELLNLDYIKEIYNDCIRHVSKYLLEEYQEGVSLLNRSIMNKIALDDEDIQQYQARIDQAKLAEELREEHLEKEFINCSAFIQNVNEQVDLMVEDLQEKDPNDFSAKVSLDTIKFLTNSFPDLGCSKYIGACHLFETKFESVVKSFKSSVLSSEFDKSASDIRKLHDALVILKGHLDSEDVEAKYIDVKQYLIKYLNDSTDNLSHLFSQEKLAANDVASLNSCVSILEATVNTFALQPYISKVSVNDIYTELLSKIVNYFEEIVTKIDKQFQNENSFHLLEQYMEQLDLIRKIPTINIKTTQSYCSTLEKLIGYVYESIKMAEHLLRDLFRREENVNYEKLTKCLSNLKSAKWIEKYRTGVYSDVINDVEKQIIQHIKALKESVMEDSLDLDNFHKIENVSKIVSEMNEMKQIEQIVPEVKEYINSVNAWFLKVVNDVFGIIKETYNTEKWKAEGYQTLNFDKAEKAFRYLDICKNLRPSFQTDCVSVLNHFEQFIRCFSTFVETEMQDSFEIITQHKNKDKEIFEKARVLFSRLRTVSEIREKYPRVFSCFANKKIVEEWKIELTNYLTELADEMRKLSAIQRTESLNIKIAVARALSKLDSFLEGEKYIDVYNKYRDIFFSQTSNICEKVFDAIKKYDYERVSLEMLVLKSSSDVGEHYFQEAKRALASGLDNLIEDTMSQATMLGDNIELEPVKAIVENLKRIQKAKQSVSSYYDKSNEIDNYITVVKKLIEDRIKRFSEGVTVLITINNFYEADQKIDFIRLIRPVLGNYCTEASSNQIETLKKHLNDVVSKDVVDKYSQMDLSEYSMNPPTDIFAKFGEVNKTNLIYDQARTTIKESILTKFRKELETAKLEQPPDPENAHIRKFESAVKHVPDAMRNALEVELKHCKDDITRLIQDNEDNLHRTFTNGNLKTIKNVLQQYQDSEGMRCYANKGRELALKQVDEIIQKINQNFEQCNITAALENIKKLYDYKIELENLVDMQRPWLEVRLRVINVFQEASHCCSKYFSNDQLFTITDQTVNVIENSLICIIEFMKFIDELKDQPILSSVLAEDFHEKINILHRNMSHYFSEHQKKYEEALEKIDAVSLKHVLENMNKWNSLFTKIKIYDDTKNSTDSLVYNIVKIVKNLTSYSIMLESIFKTLEELKGKLIDIKLINTEIMTTGKHRDEFYRNLNEKFVVLEKAKILTTCQIGMDVSKVEEECLASLKRQTSEFFAVIDSLLEKFSEDGKMTRQDYDKLNLHFNNLISFKQEMKIAQIEIDEKIKKIEKIIFDKIHVWAGAIGLDSPVQEIAHNLMNMKRVGNNILSFEARVNERIDEVLHFFRSETKNTMIFSKLAALLNQDTNGEGQGIISEHKAFRGYSISLFNDITLKHGIEYVLANLKGDSVDKKQLRKRYDDFIKIYNDLVKQYLKPNIELDQVISNTKLIAGNKKQKSNCVEWDAHVRNQVPKLAAHIFAIWTLKNAEDYFEVVDAENSKNYLLRPHAGQVVSIFRMLGIGDNKEELKNNLVQTGTGEGKSVILGVTACILALLGFDVRCACYSEYLSQRDYTGFLPIFDSLDLLNYIRYGTFNKLCEDIINENGDIREVVERIISNKNNDDGKNIRQIKRAKILLIDEVDVFFSRDFYGNTYTPSASLRDPTITSLVNLIWTHRNLNLNLKKVQNASEYDACCSRFATWEPLILEAVKDMLSDVNNFESHDYVVKQEQDKIGYIEQGKIVYNVIYGYKTLFAYYSEHEKGKITKKSLEENISIGIKCGSFSYAEMPLEFEYTMGVTGTLETLSEPERQVIEGVYKIMKNTYVPSVFGQNNLQFIEKDDIRIENNDDYFNVIGREINDRLAGKSSEKRAVLVLFQTEQKLKDFYESETLEPVRNSVARLTEGVSVEEKENLVRRATASGQVTLLTRNFGRGTDFVCYDSSVSKSGGTHVIQTFLSEELSEEKQIKGRTARQGNYGSYSMVLLDRELEKFHIEKDNIEDVKKGKGVLVRLADALSLTKTYDTVYDLLNDKRTDLFKTQYEANMKYVEQVKERHQIARNFLFSLHAGDINCVREFLVKENKGVETNGCSRTVCLMDATGSMSHLLHNCKNTVNIMFERASKILKDNNILSDAFQIQFVVYRNYSSLENKIIQSSPWETKPDNLRTFMNTIDVEGGLGNEAIEIGLWHANNENKREKITQVILIGDASPNTSAEIDKKREILGEKYWSKTKFARPTYYEAELAKLASNDIPVHAFYVKKRAEESFREIADKTGGRCELLDINSTSGSLMLTDLVTEEILRNVGGDIKGNALVEAYKNKFGKSYK